MATAVQVAPAVKQPTQTGDIVARFVVLMFACVILVVAILVAWQLWIGSAEARHKFGLGFITTSVWNPVTEQFGAAPFIYGTLVTSALALLISVPLGVGAAIFLSELAPARLSNALTFLVELLAAIPSVIYGMLAIFTLVPLMRTVIEPALKSVLGFLPLFSGYPFGFGYLTAGCVLAIMTFPFIISVSRESLLAVPREQREGRARSRCYPLGEHLADRRSLRPARHLRFHLPRTRPRPWRDYGRHHGHRQRRPHQSLHCSRRATASRPSSPANSAKLPALSTPRS